MEIKMRKLPIAAAALLLGTSAYAMIPTDGTMQGDPYTVEPTTAVTPADEAPALQPAAVDTWTTYSADPTDPALKTGTASSDEVKAAELAKADAQFDAATEADWDAAAKAKLDSAAVDDSATLQPASMETGFVTDEGATETAAAGPVVASADLAPHPATGNYPACRPGPGDDHCIQLYERGVQARLASWTQPTGGFAGASDSQVAMGADSATETERLNQQALADSARTLQMARAGAVTTDGQALETAQADEAGTEAGMGGPYEPVADDAGMNGDGTVDTALGETPKDESEV
jgi:hypothetical protein